MPIFKQNHLPDFVGREMLLPRRHHGGPWEAFVRQTDSTLSDPPEDKRFLQLGNRTRVREVGRDGIEGKRVQPAPVQVIPMAEMTILEEDLATLSDIFQIPLLPGCRGTAGSSSAVSQ